MQYWDLNESERAALTREQVEAFIAVELMQRGVLRAGPLVLVDEPPMPEPDGEVFVTRIGAYHHGEVAWRTEVAARISYDGSLGKLTSKYYGDYPNQVAVQFVEELEEEPGHEVKRVPVYSASLRAQMAEAIDAAASARSENQRRRTEHKRTLEAQEKALKGMWDDWNECRSQAHEMERIASTLREYVELANGDVEIAAGFLEKTFGAEKIAAARHWGALPIVEITEPTPEEPLIDFVKPLPADLEC